MTREQREPAAELPHVDVEMLADILSFTSVEFVVESIDEFLIAAGDGLETIANAILREDRRVVERVAHRLRGSCGVTGAMRLSQRCASLEESAPEASPAELSELLSRAKEELGCVNRDLAAERRRLLLGSAGGAG
jgi:HPt (histidine-containing phosphotransfer) domain-containing protein